ncbi:neurotrophin-7-like [Mercenaria mercenaria]|uniref:neurotrophin-7-like n=1 Tax=Mercenaria mercenaria TaxID=6596 RepID=UPI00234EA9E8|nr:neurotrophin-7-like [Mercenaria mercenaria]
METVFAMPSSMEQHTTTEFHAQTVSSPELNNGHDTINMSANYKSFSTEIVVPETTARAKTNIRYDKQRVLKEKKKDRNVTKLLKVKRSRRKVKRHQSLGLKQKSCPTRTSYVSKKTAEDIFGNIVNVYPVIHIGKLALDQLFYESFCDVEKCSCAGVGSRKFKSSCQTTHSYTYARTVKSGEIGWSFIKVKSGCSCVIQEKKKNRYPSITDLLS